jgi:stalled ribosome rescue protein Dom34
MGRSKTITAQRKELRQAVKVLRDVKNGDIILVKPNTWSQYQLDLLAEAFNKTRRKDCIIVVVNRLSDVATLSAERMGAFGWQKVPVENTVEENADGSV